MRRRLGPAVSCLAVLALLVWLPAVAQDAAPAVTTRQGPEVIAAADIQVRADADERFAAEVVARSKASTSAAGLDKRIESLADSVRAEGRHTSRDDLKSLSIPRLETLSRHWNFYARELEQWRRGLKQAFAPYSEDAAELARRRANWEATRQAAVDAGVAPALNNRIRSVLAQISLAEQAVSAPIDQQIRLSRRANAVQTEIEANQTAVAAAVAYNDSRLGRIDSPPLWKLWRDPQAAGSGLRSVQAGLEVETRFLNEYYARTTAFHAHKQIVALALLVVLVWLSYRSRKTVSDDPSIQDAMRVLRRPLSSWLVLVMVATVVLEPDAPMLMHQAALLLAMVPVLRLLPPKVYELVGPWPYVATALYLLQRLGYALVGNVFYYRTYLLGVTVLAVLLLTWLLWRSRPRAGDPPLPLASRVTRLVGSLAIVALLVSAVANLFGNVSLAEMLTSGILDSGYVGLVLFAGVTVLSSVTRLLLARRAVSRFAVVTQHAGPLLHALTRVLRFVALGAWLIVVLNEFRVYLPVKNAVTAVLTYKLGFGQISITLGGILLFLFSVWLAFWAAKTVRYVLQDEVLPKMSLPRGVANSVSSLSYYAVVIAGLFVALAAAGFEVSQLAIVVGALGVGIGFGLQNVVNNFVSGMILMFERPIQPGDVVEVSGTSGKVREIGMRATTLSTFEGADVVVPNGMLLSEKLINWTLSDMDRRIDVNVGVAYGTDPRKVLQLLMEVTTGTPGIATDPAPTVLFVGFGASSLDFGIRAWTNNFGDWVKIRSELTVRVNEALKDHGIEIPFPQQDLHVRSVAPEAGAALAGLGKPATPRTDG